MTDHDHKQVVPGCYRCDLGRDEERESMLAEIDTLRADLREAVELLRDNGEVRMFVFRADRAREVSRWAMRCGALLEKHKETP